MSDTVAPVQQEEEWRGVAAEEIEEISRTTGLRLQARSRKLLGSLLRPHIGRTSLAIGAVIGGNLANLAGPLLIAAAIDQGIPAAMDGGASILVWCVVGYAICAVLTTFLRWAFLRVSGRVGQDLLLDLRGRIFRHSQRLSVGFHESYTSGKVISRLTSDVDALQDLLEEGLDSLFNAALSVAGIAIILIYLDAPLAAVVVAGFLPIYFIWRWFRRRSMEAYRGTRGAIAKVIVQFVESMNGIRAVQAFRRQRRNEQIMTGFNTQFRDANMDALGVMATFVATIRMIGNVSLAVVLAWGAYRVAGGSLELGVLTAFTVYLRRFYDPFDELAMFANSYSSATAALEKISGLLEEKPSVPEPSSPAALPHARGAVRFAEVEFGYPGTSRQVLPRFSLDVPARQTVALVGATGAGKTTLAKLVSRFYDPSSGSVQLDGVDLRSVADTDLRRAVVMVTQENFLFSGSVADNIALGRPSASRSEIEAAAAEVGAHEFIAALPHGYDTDVRKRGGRLSAGQRQMVAFARAFLADPAVLVLDEATSSLDVPTERAVQAALETVLADRTAFIIAHRLSTVLIADRVLVLDGGIVVEDGSPEELIGERGRFAALHTAWRDSLA